MPPRNIDWVAMVGEDFARDLGGPNKHILGTPCSLIIRRSFVAGHAEPA
jgi:hypothetical protein